MAGDFERRSALLGIALGFVVGGISGYAGGSLRVEPPPPRVSAPAPRPSGAPVESSSIPRKVKQDATPSFAQQGEDLVLNQLARQVGIREPTYLDIGANEPILGNNTYVFYLLGSKGVLVEPNPVLAEKLRKTRPRDVVLEYGVGVTDQSAADFYIMAGDGQLNTFSKDQVDVLVSTHGLKLEKTIKRKLVPINKIMEEHFKDRAPDILSIDIEGLDLAILKTLDWSRWRPRIVCVETSDIEDGRVDTEILKFFDGLGYTVRGGSFVNTIFLDEKTWRAELATAAKARDAGAAEAGAK